MARRKAKNESGRGRCRGGLVRRMGLVALIGWAGAIGTAVRAEPQGTISSEALRAAPPARADSPAEVSVPSPRALRWREVDALPSRGEGLRAIAFDREAGLAVGDDAGVSWQREGAWLRSQTPAVRDLAFDFAGRLWIGTEAGLFVWTNEARPQRRTLRDGEASGRVARIEVDAGALVIATAGGAYWSTSGRIFQPLGAGSADQPVLSAALRRVVEGGERGGSPAERSTQTEVWTFGLEGLVRTRGIATAAGLRVVDRVLALLPRPAAEAGAVDLVIDRAGARLAVVYPDAIAVRSLAAADPHPDRWHWIRPVLPPGASILRLVIDAPGRAWLVTDRGLLEARALDAPFARTSPPAGSGPCVDVVDAPGLPGAARALALCRSGLLALVDERVALASAPAPRGADRAASRAVDRLAPDPPVAEIRRRALERVGLSIERAESLWRGLRRRAYWPELELRGGYDVDRDRDRSHDQSFVSGDVRNLTDRGRGEAHQYGAAIVLDWDLGGLAYPDDSVDLVRELRQVTSLRDDVSDEIHQLYFERQRIRARLAGPADAFAPGEAADLALRAAELDAGLDAWTGGWISAWRVTRAGPPDHPRPSEPSID
ncbi:MAG: hypothetical protein R3F21_11040 [Myxococcota bacterium]